ncbi:hypothetical protein [Burkholderia pseudomallei]|uniref:hypothetical protein n=1 Tax=Burkholderia pseudomallei TaxID=28450 RepID=UPI0004078671|nr:hypothetical protein [Burkholderia pseudomallei]MCD4545390.1 hypothetical protein [Burkholderia pseudomallei]
MLKESCGGIADRTAFSCMSRVKRNANRSLFGWCSECGGASTLGAPSAHARHRFVIASSCAHALMRSCAIQMPMRGDRHADPRIGGARRASCTPRERMRRAVRVTRGDSRVRCAAA